MTEFSCNFNGDYSGGEFFTVESRAAKIHLPLSRDFRPNGLRSALSVPLPVDADVQGASDEWGALAAGGEPIVEPVEYAFRR